MQFKKNEELFSGNGEKIIIESLLGEGGQGEVYLANYNGKKMAFKVYKKAMHSDFRYNLKSNIDKGSPSDDFLWPELLIDFDDGSLGYLMSLRPKNYVSFVSYLTGKNAFKDKMTLLTWCIQMCIAFKKLHERGYSYQDLNDGSFFFDPNTGALLICDNDNVTADKKNLGILGKMRYMAPEVVRGETVPDMHSDRFSLAVILFLALCLGNPYEGERLKNYDVIDERAEYEMFGKKPVFVYHKTDKSNRPIRGYHTSVIKRWEHLPLYIKEAFHRTFADGLCDRENGRTTELEWIKLLTRYRDELVTCSVCGGEYIYGLAETQITKICPSCNSKTQKARELHIGKHRIIIEPGKKLYEPHIDKYSAEYNRVIGEVITAKNNAGFWGIRIDIGKDIQIKDSAGNIKIIKNNGVFPILNNLYIQFDENTIGEIK